MSDHMNSRDYGHVPPSSSYQVLNSDSEFLANMRRFARWERIVWSLWAVLAIAGIACVATALGVI